VANARADFL